MYCLKRQTKQKIFPEKFPGDETVAGELPLNWRL